MLMGKLAQFIIDLSSAPWRPSVDFPVAIRGELQEEGRRKALRFLDRGLLSRDSTSEAIAEH